jgi:3-oxoacyl-[acyl-carrier protein] reductase
LEGPEYLVNETTGRKINVLVNNAGVAITRPLKDIKIQQWKTQVDLNARGILFLTQTVLPHLARNSRIVSLSSVRAR